MDVTRAQWHIEPRITWCSREQKQTRTKCLGSRFNYGPDSRTKIRLFPSVSLEGHLSRRLPFFVINPRELHRKSPRTPILTRSGAVHCAQICTQHPRRVIRNENRPRRTLNSARSRSMARKIEGSPAHHGPISRDTHFPIFRTIINTQRILTGGSASTQLHGAWKIIKKQSSPEFLTKTRSKARTTTPPSSF
jgi:hypothetical protein